MSNALALHPPAEGDFDFREFARLKIGEWSAICQQALDQTRRSILEGHPTAQQLAEHRTGLKWLLRIARGIHATAADPDFPDRQIADELSGRLTQLEHSWRVIHDRMPDAEADAAREKLFPE